MPCLRIFLGVLFVMMALVLTNQPLFLQNIYSDADSPAQSNGSDDRQSDQVANVDGFLFQKRIALQTPAPTERSSEIAKIASEKSLSFKISRPIPFLIPARAFISRTGLLPRAPSLG